MGLVAVGVTALVVASSVAEARARVDRVAARFSAPELGGSAAPRFILERELAFEARLEALSEPAFRPTAERPYRPRHVRAASERHVAETLLSALEVSPQPSPEEVADRVHEAQAALTARVGGDPAITSALRAEGLGRPDLVRLLQRQARASLYLDRMVAPMLDPSEAELRAVHRSGRSPYKGRPYEEVRPLLRRWLVARRLREATLDYYEGARIRVRMTLLSGA